MTAAPSIGGAGLGMGFGFRNRIINGAMVIDQRGSASSPINNSASVNTYITDRFAIYGASATKMSGQQSTTTTTNFVNSLLITSSAATTPAAGDAYGVRQVIEGTNIGDLSGLRKINFIMKIQH